MLVKVFKRILNFCWLLPGFLLWASFPPMGERFDCFFALAPLLYLSRNGTVKRSLRLWFVNGFLFWFATLSWMPAIVKNNGPWPLVVLGWACLAAYCALFFGAFGWLSSLYWRWSDGAVRSPQSQPEGGRDQRCGIISAPVCRRFLGLLFVEPVLWCGLELLRSRLFGGFSWNQLGVAPINAGFGSPAAFGGVYLVSAVVILVNGTLASIAERFITRDRCWWRSLETFVPFLLIFGLYSAAGARDSVERRREDTADDFQKAEEHLKVALIQRNFPCCFKPQDREDPFAVYSNLCANIAYLRPDLVILPESAYAEIGVLDGRGAEKVWTAKYFSEWLMQLTGAKAVLAGGGRYTADGKAYNSAALYVADGRSGKDSASPVGGQSGKDSASPVGFQIYDKVHLVPFGEYIPGDKLIPALQKLAPVGSCTPGELKLLHCPPPSHFSASVPLGIAICYEDTDSAQMRELAKMGARALVFITNDSWFSYSQETISHAWQATARAIETGLPVIRVGNSGVTGVIYPDGRANWLCGRDDRPLVDAKGTLFDRVRLPPASSPSFTTSHTFYVRFGDLPLGSAFALLILGYILVYLYSNYEKRRIVSLQVR